jgi:hypothetical protein
VSAPTPASAPPRIAPGYRVPSLGYRILVAALRLIPAFFLLIALPVAALDFASSRGVSLPISTAAVAIGGLALLALGTARYIAKPTRAFGPLSIAYSLAGVVYLLYAISRSPYRLVIPGGSATVVAGYSTFLELMLIAPVLGIVAGILTTIEDARSPTERLVFDYPA